MTGCHTFKTVQRGWQSRTSQQALHRLLRVQRPGQKTLARLGKGFLSVSGKNTIERQIMSQEDIGRALARVAHEILERNRGARDLLLVGIRTRGVFLAHRLAEMLAEFEGAQVPVASLDISLYRDDLQERSRPVVQPTDMPVTIQGKRVVLVDDVLFTGRTIRAAMDALNDFGRPKRIQLAILLDRGHRELPIRADFVGQNIPTGIDEKVKVRLLESDAKDEVTLARAEGQPDEPRDKAEHEKDEE